VALPFSRLRHVCRFEKGGYCKETKKNCAPQICPRSIDQVVAVGTVLIDQEIRGLFILSIMFISAEIN
jgi:hypothetical protein